MEKQSLVDAARALWNVWEIRGMILTSLFLQVFLFLFAGMRRRSSSKVLGTLLWLAYLSADSVAFYVLGHLAVRASEPGHQLVSFWAPFLLVHLGGQDSITAFSKQDNELWRRHLLNLVTQVAVAGYVVAMASWPDARLRAAMVLVFLCGCFKYAERTVMLCSSDPIVLSWWAKHYWSVKLNNPLQQNGEGKKTDSEDDPAEDLTRILGMMSHGRSSSGSSRGNLFWEATNLIPDIITVDAPINRVNKNVPDLLEGFLQRSSEEVRQNAYEFVGAVLGHAFRRLYTKGTIRHFCMQCPGRRYWYIALLSTPSTLFPCVLISMAIAIFMAAEKEHQQLHASTVDIKVSYLLLVVAIVLDVSSLAIFIVSYCFPAQISHLASYCCFQQPPCCKKKQWSEELGQYSMISTAGMPRLWRLLSSDVTRTPFGEDQAHVKIFILDTLLVSGASNQCQIASTRGQLALDKWKRRHYAAGSGAQTALPQVEKTIVRSSDIPTSVLILHIATEICYHHRDHDQPGKMKSNLHRDMSRQISNYVMYLVFKCGVMLTTKSQLVHDHAEDEIVEILRLPPQVYRGRQKEAATRLWEAHIQIEHEERGGQQDSTMGEIIVVEFEGRANNDNSHLKILEQSNKSLKSPVLPRVGAVAHELIGIEDEDARWDLIAAVWVEMLFYIAPRCGVGFHYERLSKGGEFITHVLALMYYLGPFLPPPDTGSP